MLVIFLFLAPLTLSAETPRVFKSKTGQELTATFLSVKGATATLRRPDGKSFEIPLSRLSEADQDYIHKTATKTSHEAAQLNHAAGQPIASGAPFPDLIAADLAASLRLRPESTSQHSKSWRLFASFTRGYTLFGAMPYSVALYSDEKGNVQNLSIVFANLSDFGSTAGFAVDYYKSSGTELPKNLQQAIALDVTTVSTAITSILGTGTTQRFGEGNTRRTITRWDWNGHAFLLSSQEGESVSLSIVSTTMADTGGKSSSTDDATLKTRLLNNVIHSENGDTLITQIPWVNQRPVDTSIPATFERTMRTMGMQADMYLLGTFGRNPNTGSVNIEKFLEAIKSTIYSKGRRIKEDAITELKMRDVKRYIDQGIPILWTLHSTPAYNEIAAANTTARIAADPALRSTVTTLSTTLLASPTPIVDYHLSMLIGYNEATHEIAVSDTRGKKYELRWVPLNVANWATDTRLFMILP